MNAFDQLAAMPGFRDLSDLAWRLFGVNIALVSPDGQRTMVFDMEKRAQPFCRALDQLDVGRALCAMCDQNRFLEARREAETVRYRCHAGLREFIVPMIRQGEILALLQCGQVHDRPPTPAEWRDARKDLVAAGIDARRLHKLFRKNRVMTPDRQHDLVELMELIANRLVHAHEHRLRPEPGRMQAQLGRAVTFIEVHLSERLPLRVIAQVAGVSARNLARLFRREFSTSVVEFILRRRVSRARDRLRNTDLTCAEIAFESGFGSVQHFNRIFRRIEGVSPREWRRQVLSAAVPKRPAPDALPSA